ncbi:MAG TPA: hypothetical protein DCL08_08330 [Anaerolineaceae bacterium]|nr:hypothetical protein [Anaerolineaceae bacterium]
MKTIQLRKSSPPRTLLNLKVCDTFFNRFRGLMLTKELAPDGGIMLVGDAESKVNASIHTMFMRYDITVLWLDKDRVLVDKVLAKKWKLYYAPQAPAQYILEMHPDRFDDFAIGDKFEIL